MNEIFLGRQPILDRDTKLVGFELLFRAADASGAEFDDDSTATATVIAHAFGELGIPQVLGGHKGFLNVNAEFLLSDMIQLLPKEQVVLEILESVEIDATVLARCRELKTAGYRVAVDDVVQMNGAMQQLKGLVDVVKVDVVATEPRQLERLMRDLRGWPCLLLAEKVESREAAQQCRDLGFHLFQGYYFARPQVLSGKRADPSRMALVKLLSMVMADAGVSEIEAEFKHHPNLTYNLMRMVNSAAMGLQQKITSLRHAIVMLGRKQIQRWIQLLLYTASSQGDQSANPLLQLAATRGRLMELLAGQLHPGGRELHDQAFMVGILSLLDTLTGMPLPEVVKQLQVAEDVRIALLGRTGELGHLLALVERKEANDLRAVGVLIAGLPGLSLQGLVAAELEAAAWANAVATPAE